MTTKFVADRLREIDANRQFLLDQIAELVAENRRLKAENTELKAQSSRHSIFSFLRKAA